MTDKEIFNKVVEKAEKNGYKIPFLGAIYSYNDSYAGEILTYKQCIFNHDFAKAFFGMHDVDMHGKTVDESWEEEFKDSELFMDKEDFEYNTDWQMSYLYHLKGMVWVKEPLKYLEKFLK